MIWYSSPITEFVQRKYKIYARQNDITKCKTSTSVSSLPLLTSKERKIKSIWITRINFSTMEMRKIYLICIHKETLLSLNTSAISWISLYGLTSATSWISLMGFNDFQHFLDSVCECFVEVGLVNLPSPLRKRSLRGSVYRIYRFVQRFVEFFLTLIVRQTLE